MSSLNSGCSVGNPGSQVVHILARPVDEYIDPIQGFLTGRPTFIRLDGHFDLRWSVVWAGRVFGSLPSCSNHGIGEGAGSDTLGILSRLKDIFGVDPVFQCTQPGIFNLVCGIAARPGDAAS